jgi:hypothetical protein
LVVAALAARDRPDQHGDRPPNQLCRQRWQPIIVTALNGSHLFSRFNPVASATATAALTRV